MKSELVAEVRVFFYDTPGGPKVRIEDVVQWVAARINGTTPEGYNGLRYADATVVEARVIDAA